MSKDKHLGDLCVFRSPVDFDNPRNGRRCRIVADVSIPGHTEGYLILFLTDDGREEGNLTVHGDELIPIRPITRRNT